MRSPAIALVVLLPALFADAGEAEAEDCDGILERAYTDAERREIVWERCHDSRGATLPYLDSPSGNSIGAEPGPAPSVTHFEVVDVPDLECAVTAWARGRPTEGADGDPVPGVRLHGGREGGGVPAPGPKSLPHARGDLPGSLAGFHQGCEARRSARKSTKARAFAAT